MINFLSFEGTIFEDGILKLFGLNIHWYAICILIGIILAVILGVREGKKLGIASDHIYTGVVIIVPLSIVGARLWYVLFNLDSFNSIQQVLGLDGKGLAGLAIQGGVIAALISVYVYCRYKKISLYRILDLVAPGFLIGQICGRWGNFFNQELYGPVVENVELFKTLLPEFITENMRIGGLYRHPTFLYESALNFVGFIIILVLRRKFKKLESGDLIGVYLTWYGMVRIFTETLRGKSGANEILMWGPIPVSIALSVIFIIVGIGYIIGKRFIGPRKNYHEILEEISANRYDTILFDLDGTLLNTKELIDRSFIHTFTHFRPDMEITDEDLDSFFGPPLRKTFSRFSQDENEIEQMINYYREFNISAHDEMVTAFPGAKSLINTLARKGYKLGVVSSKKRDLVKHGLELFGLLDKMDVVLGEEDAENPKPSPDGINKALKLLNSKKALYVGDGVGDIQAGKNAGIDTIGVLYSERKEQILAEKPTYTIKDLNQILIILVE